MELICTETYRDIRFTLNEGDSTKKVPFLTEDELNQLLKDYPEKFKKVGKTESESELKIEQKVPKVENQKVKFTKK